MCVHGGWRRGFRQQRCDRSCQALPARRGASTNAAVPHAALLPLQVSWEQLHSGHWASVDVVSHGDPWFLGQVPSLFEQHKAYRCSQGRTHGRGLKGVSSKQL